MIEAANAGLPAGRRWGGGTPKIKRRGSLRGGRTRDFLRFQNRRAPRAVERFLMTEQISQSSTRPSAEIDAMTPTEAKAELEQVKSAAASDPSHPYVAGSHPRHASVRDRMGALYARAYGGEAEPSTGRGGAAGTVRDAAGSPDALVLRAPDQNEWRSSPSRTICSRGGLSWSPSTSRISNLQRTARAPL